MAITMNDFCAAFINEWRRIGQEHPYEITDTYENDTAWTEFMLSSDGFLEKVMKNISGKKQLKLSFHRDWNNYDCAYLSGDENAVVDSDASRPESRVEIVIEHENIFSDIDTEMAKLIQIEAPLKVLITYAPYQADQGVNKNPSAIRNKLTDTWKSIDDSGHLMAEDSEFLVIIGDREKKTDQISDIAWNWVARGGANPDPLR
ncbi:hypothetical protein EP232_00970 [bacterium]|nr:MAG: hypothetical protein EP232_00970 [bacterium]